jgi:hypothetical protein
MDAGVENALLLEIARCPHVRNCITNPDAVHPCSEIVRAQESKLLDHHQVPEPWLGNLATAPLLFISSNPSISSTEDYPRWSRSDDEILSYFNERFLSRFATGYPIVIGMVHSRPPSDTGLAFAVEHTNFMIEMSYADVIML